MKRFSPFHILGVMALGGLISCVSDSENTYYSDLNLSDVAITEFKLQADDSILANLDSVFFTIDLDKGLIYNADSLPVGTRVNSLIIVPTLPVVSKAEIIQKLEDGRDTTLNFATNSTDSLNFERGPVILRLTSLDQKVERDYAISVNVHKCNPDLLTWSQTAMREIPGSTDAVKNFGMTESDGKLTGLLYDGTTKATAISVDKADVDGDWATWSVTLPENADVATLTATATAKYMIVGGKLMASTDNMQSWSDCGVAMNHIYGAYGESILGTVKLYNGSWHHVSYPGGVTAEIPDGCPVSETSQMMIFTTPWSNEPLAMFIGGKLADGNPTGTTWAYDGSQWACISASNPPALSGLSLVPYFSFRTSNQWVITERSTLMAFGGRDSDGNISRTTYISYDQGIHWHNGGELVELPSYIDPRTASKSFVIERTNTDLSRAATGEWLTFTPAKLPMWYALAPSETSVSRATTPITEWQTPYIYMFGGFDADGRFVNQVWCGAINRLIFKPLY